MAATPGMRNCGQVGQAGCGLTLVTCDLATPTRDASPGDDAPRPKVRPRRAASLHRGENAVNERRDKEAQRGTDQGGMQECHLVARPPTTEETNQVVPLIPYELYEALIRLYIGAEFLDITHRSPAVPASTSTSTSTSTSASPPPEPSPHHCSDTDSVEDLILNMSIAGQATSTPHGEERGQGSAEGGAGSGMHTPRLDTMRHPEAARLLLSLKLRGLRDYTDFKDDSLYPNSPLCQDSDGNHPSLPQEQPPQRMRTPSGPASQASLKTPPDTRDVPRPVSVQSGGQERPASRGPETVRSIKTNDQARRLRRECSGVGGGGSSGGGGGRWEGVKVESGEALEGLALPDNCCFETAFTSDSPQTRIIPQKSVDSIHFRHGEKQRPKSLAVPPLSGPPGPWDSTVDASSASDLFRSSIISSTSTEYLTALAPLSPLNRSRSAGNLQCLEADSSAPAPPAPAPARSLASRIRDSIKRKNLRDDSLSKKRGGRVMAGAANHLRTKSGGYVNPGLSGTAPDDTASTVSSEGLGVEGSRLAHLRTKSGGFLNLALAPAGNSTDTLDSVPSAPLSARSDPGLLDHRPAAAPIPRPLSRHRTLTPDGCLSHSLHSTASGNSIYHSALSHTSHTSQASRGSTPTSLASHTPLVSPSLRPISGMAGIYSSGLSKGSTTQPQASRDTPTDLYKHLSSSANELSDGWMDRTPHGRAPPFGRGGVWRLYHSSPSKRRIGRRRGAQVLNTFARSILLCEREADHDEVLALRVVAFLMDAHEEVMAPPQDLTVLVHRRLALRHRSQVGGVDGQEGFEGGCGIWVVYAAAAGERAITHTYCRQVTASEYQRQQVTGSQLFLTQLLDQLVDNTAKFSSKERKRKLKEFKSLYPEVYRARFPEEEEENKKPEGKSRMKSLIKLASLTSLGRSRQMRM
ncbi:DEP domain-containing protein 1A [Portunus trituberculatus]|uniref:DEP domain-containing protein 1A n=1 Tax=Portunus trituberculatus TaxID=210409 RepID=A0A5B7DEV5_PORTR|nr:DEP domain-containing protein 1A [Portunus trituberculatus]